MYKGDADWTLIREVRNNPRMTIPVFGNGDIDTPEKAVAYRKEYGVDGIMIGRASIGNPWIFNQIKHYMQTGEHLPKPDIRAKAEAAIEHLEMSVKWKGEILGVAEMKRHYTNYFKGIEHFKETRMKLVTSYDLIEIREILDGIKENADKFEMAQ